MGRFQQIKARGLHSEAGHSICRRLMLAGFLCLLAAATLRADDSLREAATTQFQAAEMQRAEIEARPEIARSLKDYTSLVAAYRKVYLTTPLAIEDPAAINEVAGLYRTMGDLFDEKYYRDAVETYQFLLHEYPDNRYREDALLAVAHIEQENLHTLDLAKSAYEEFLSLHPRSSHVAEVRAIIVSLGAPSGQSAKASPALAPRTSRTATAQPSEADSAIPTSASLSGQGSSKATGETSQAPDDTAPRKHAEISNIRTWNADTYTRVVIDLGAQVKYQASRIPNPDRIFFDIDDASLASALAHKSLQAPDSGFVKDIRIAQNQPDMIRVVLDVSNAKDYSVFYLPDPDRLIVDVYGNSGTQTLEAGRNSADSSPVTEAKKETPANAASAAVSNLPSRAEAGNKEETRVASLPAAASTKPSDAQSAETKKPSTGSLQAAANPSGSGAQKPEAVAKLNLPAKPDAGTRPDAAVKPDVTGKKDSQIATAQGANAPHSGSDKPVAGKEATEASPAKATPDTSAAPLIAKAVAARSPFDVPSAGDVNQDATAKKDTTSSSRRISDTDEPASPATTPATPKKALSAKADAGRQQTAVLQPPSIPEPTRNGEESLSRALGLKIGRIVIDPGHGGHDTGTIGPSGLMEKDLCLDVALRLGKLIRQRLPGADVVYTREDDTFVPLEQRTEIANDAHADLFLSIHANSSSVRSARGVETYYLNVDGTSSAMEVAARENALSENSVHDLQGLVTKIAQTDKVAESRDFASDIQDSLAKRMDNLRGEPNRGVRKAPFVVLIGADMPSVLAEISFLSNPGDEQWLKKAENRQRVAEGLYQGIESYLHSTNSLSVDKSPSAARSSTSNPADTTRPGIVARAGNP